MLYFTKEQIQDAKQMDLLTYLQRYEPHELVRLSSTVHCTKTHDSLKISNGKWTWWSRSIGGRSALDYLIKVRGMEFTEAVGQILDYMGKPLPEPEPEQNYPLQNKEFRLPEPYKNNQRVTKYLQARGIHPDLIRDCIDTGFLYESAKYHNCIFVGKDATGTARYAMKRGTTKTRFIGDVAGSDKRFAFHLEGKEPTHTLNLFESPIEVLSFRSLEMLAGHAGGNGDLLTLSGIYCPRKDGSIGELPLALSNYLAEHEQIQHIVIRTNHDGPGLASALAMKTKIPERYTKEVIVPPKNMDYNEYLQKRLAQNSLSHTER